jgi:hypothetical protein
MFFMCLKVFPEGLAKLISPCFGGCVVVVWVWFFGVCASLVFVWVWFFGVCASLVFLFPRLLF